MKKIFTTFAAIFQIIAVLTSLTACDEGDIRQRDVTYAQGGFTVKMTGRLTGISQWDDGLMVVLAAFDGQDRVYDMGEMRITSDCEGRDTTLVWSNLNRNARSVELCVVNKLRRRMATLKAIDLDADADTVTMEVGDMDAGLYAAVQGLFDQRCAGCHGGGNYANLKLNRENAITQLVNVPASLFYDLRIYNLFPIELIYIILYRAATLSPPHFPSPPRGESERGPERGPERSL